MEKTIPATPNRRCHGEMVRKISCWSRAIWFENFSDIVNKHIIFRGEQSENEKTCNKLCVAYIADCQGKTNHSSVYLHFAYVYLDSIRWLLILSCCVRACIRVCALSYFRIFREPKIIFAIVSDGVRATRSVLGLALVRLFLSLLIRNRLHIILNPMFTQFTVHISSVQNPKTNKNTLCVCICCCIFWCGERVRDFQFCAHNPEWNETKRVIFSI